MSLKSKYYCNAIGLYLLIEWLRVGIRYVVLNIFIFSLTITVSPQQVGINDENYCFVTI